MNLKYHIKSPFIKVRLPFVPTTALAFALALLRLALCVRHGLGILAEN